MPPVHCICAGHVCLDITPAIEPKAGADLRELLIPGSLVIIGAPKLSSGGPVSNVGIPLVKLGIRTAFMGKVGDDLFGTGLRELFAPYGAEPSMQLVEITQLSPGVTSYSASSRPLSSALDTRTRPPRTIGKPVHGSRSLKTGVPAGTFISRRLWTTSCSSPLGRPTSDGITSHSRFSA